MIRGFLAGILSAAVLLAAAQLSPGNTAGQLARVAAGLAVILMLANTVSAKRSQVTSFLGSAALEQAMDFSAAESVLKSEVQRVLWENGYICAVDVIYDGDIPKLTISGLDAALIRNADSLLRGEFGPCETEYI